MNLATVAIAVRFKSTVALHDISLFIPKESRVCIVGKSHSGKTTLLKVLAGLISPSDGSVRWNGHDVSRMPESERQICQRRMGMVFQSDALFDAMTARDNVTFPLLRRGTARTEAVAKAEVLLEKTGLLESADALPETLSGGMKKRLGLARALVCNPEVLFLDEPTAGLDPKTARLMLDLVDQMAPGKTIVTASNQPTPPDGTRFIWLEEGRLAYDGPYREVTGL